MMKIAAEAAPTGVLLLVCFNVSADYQDGLDAYTFGDYAAAMEEWKAVVSSPPGDVNPAIYAEAHYAIAKLYWQGDGVEQDFRAAYEWLMKAAELGHAGAQAKLGFMYTDGLMVWQDFEQALYWYDRAAKGGNIDGLYNLGIFYYYGWGVDRDLTMAAQYLAAASALGDAPSEEALQQVLAEIKEEKGIPVGGHAQRQSGAASLAAPKPRHPHSLRFADESLEVDWQPNLAEDEGWALAAGAETDETLVDAEPDLVQEGSQAKPAPAENIAPEQTGLEAEQPEPVDPVWRDEAWIADQDPDHYTIQVMALSDLELLREQVEGFEELAPFAIYTVQKNTSPLYVLVQGSYPDVDAARAAQNSFPRKIQRKDKLWIRRFEMVQRLLD